MIRRLLALGSIVPFLIGSAFGQETGRLKVGLAVRPRVAYVGQPVDVTLEVVGAGAHPKHAALRIEGAEVTSGPTDRSMADARDPLSQRTRFITHFRVVPRRAGTLAIPAVEVHLGGDVARTAPTRLNVARIPAAGRPPEFLGGVGPFEVRAQAQPTTVRAGQTLQYKVIVTGAGALGVSAAPNLARFEGLPVRLEIDRGPDEVIADPPSHAFVFRLRPTRAGEVTLPPVAVAGFDPASARFVTKVTQGIRLTVRELPRLDPALLDYGKPGPNVNRAAEWWPWLAWTAGLAALGGSAVVVWRVRSTDRHTLSREIRRITARIETAVGGPESGRAITEGLATYLRLTIDRPEGALTPDEAGQGIASATGSDALAERASHLIALCDQAQFGALGLDGEELRDRATRFFRDLPVGQTASSPNPRS